jgi:hypothetical protein
MMAGLLAAIGAAMSGLAGMPHGVPAWIALNLAAVAAGTLAYMTAPLQKTLSQLATAVTEPIPDV